MARVGGNNLSSVEYDERTQVLTAQFKNGRIYTYDGVPKAVHDAMVASESPGTILWADVIPYYQARRIA
jgi:KTSC domain